MPGRETRSQTTLDGLFEIATDASDSVRSFLASEQGRRLRHRVAGVVIVGAPLISELPVIRRTVWARVIRTAAVTALVVKGAEWLRDWEPRAASRIPGSG
jgi:hypothetical protein